MEENSKSMPPSGFNLFKRELLNAESVTQAISSRFLLPPTNGEIKKLYIEWLGEDQSVNCEVTLALAREVGLVDDVLSSTAMEFQTGASIVRMLAALQLERRWDLDYHAAAAGDKLIDIAHPANENSPDPLAT